MLQWLLFVSLFAFIFAGDTECPYVSVIEDRRTDKSRLRLVQYNVEWLFIDYYSAMNCPGSGCTWVNQSESEKHLDYVAKVINDIKPDIINLCEVEGCDELTMLRDKLDGPYSTYLKKGTDTSTGQNVGMLTLVDPYVSLYRSDLKYTYPLAESSCGYTGATGTSGVSKHYITEFIFNGHPVALISAHLLAIPTDHTRCAEREAQASVLQNIIYGFISRDYDVIMMGDLNDYDAEIPDINGNKPTSIVLDILKGYKGDYAGKYELYSVAEQIEQTERYSDWWDSDSNCSTSSQRDYSLIDHILVTDGIRQNIADVSIYHGYEEFCGKYNSDHFPVIVDLFI